MIFEQYTEFAENYIREYDDFYIDYDLDLYGEEGEKTLEELFAEKKVFDKPILLLCFFEGEFSEKLVLETKLQTTIDEKVTLYKTAEFDESFPFDEEVMMLKVENSSRDVRRFRFNAEIYSLDAKEEYTPGEFKQAKKVIEEKDITTEGYEVFLISHL